MINKFVDSAMELVRKCLEESEISGKMIFIKQ